MAGFSSCSVIFNSKMPQTLLDQMLYTFLNTSVFSTKPNIKFMADLLTIFTLFSVYLHSLLSLNMESGMFY
ncbi:hypothetical protein VCRA2114E365_30211 [Vibrio crassostreae]|nr:hypothetical protein EDB35_107230 [Vibrio crassostreae]TCN93837.1 hypothetical protein EDB30_13111 [Vibrio crassostreae]TCT55377.1 hypothetical protein EDB42_102459 [Vibrio crassostreae]TCT79608.1 hypothetical protein EDB41_102459 [Vibrio crassostreae]TCT98038.1 hypothetical protein EDB38_102310 [Vibrio crassostreae]